MPSSYDNILAIETSTLHLMLALSFGQDRLVRSHEKVEKSHGRFLMKKINELISSSGLRKSELQAIVTSVGPGSFTGLRIGLAAAKGLAVALDIPVVGVNLFEIAAYKMQQMPDSTMVLLPLKRDEYVIATTSGGKADRESFRTVRQEELATISQQGRWVYLCADSEQELDSGRQEVRFDAADLLAVGRMKLESGEVGDLETLEPLYLQKSQAEIRFDARHKTG